MILKEYDFYEKQIKTGESFIFESSSISFALSELNRTKEKAFSQFEEEYNIEITDEQKLKINEKFQNMLGSEKHIQKIGNTLYIMLLLGYVAIMHSNLKKHQSSFRYDLERDKRYSKRVN